MCIATLFCGHHWGCNTKYFVFGRGVGVILEKRRHDIKTAHHTACCHWICWLAQTRGNRGALAEPFVILTKRLFLTLWHIMLQSSRHGNNFMSGRVYLQHPCKLSFFKIKAHYHSFYINIFAIFEDEVLFLEIIIFLHYEVTSFGFAFCPCKCKQTFLLFAMFTVGHKYTHLHTHTGKDWQQTKFSSPIGCC